MILAMACGSDVVPVAQQNDVAPPYEPRSFEDAKPQSVDLKLIPAPALPEIPDCDGEPRNVRFTLETSEVVAEFAPGVTFPFLTFNGAVPASAIVVCLGDWVEVTLKNSPGSKFAHNVGLPRSDGSVGRRRCLDRGSNERVGAVAGDNAPQG